jgi:hypothetical protein
MVVAFVTFLAFVAFVALVPVAHHPSPQPASCRVMAAAGSSTRKVNDSVK